MSHFLVLNAGSSSLKFSLFDARSERLLASGGIDFAADSPVLTVKCSGGPEWRAEVNARTRAKGFRKMLDALTTGRSPLLADPHQLCAIAHRVVHGGDHYKGAVRITESVKQGLRDLAELAPLHNPRSLDGIEVMGDLLPDVPQVAVFDTAFHVTIPEYARTYAIPLQWTRDWGIHRFGFHGLSHAYCTARAAELLGDSSARLIVAHLGHGASISAVHSGICVDTSMGFTPLDGLMMATRCGSVDPGILIYALKVKGLSADQLDHALNHESGLLGVSGLSSDMRELLALQPTNPNARLAVEVYVHRVRQTIGAMAASLGGVDALIFTGGIGENSPPIREEVCKGLGFLGFDLDGEANALCTPDADIASLDSRVRTLVIKTREDLTIVREVRRLVLETSGAKKQPTETRGATTNSGVRKQSQA